MEIVTIDGIPVYQALVDSADTGMLRISLVDDPAVQSGFMAFSKQEKAKVVQMYSVQDEDKRMVLGVVMRADFPILRKTPEGDKYYLIFSADTIRTMAEKYLAENRQNMVNLMHEKGTEQEGVQMVQFFIKDTAAGVDPEGFDGIADGSLFASFHVLNDEVWDAIKNGTYKGFSLEGVFDLTPERDKAAVVDIVDALDGLFSRILNNNETYKKMKKKGILARLAAMLVEKGNVSTDKGILAWDGDEDLKAGDAVFIEDENGNRNAAADGEYTTGDGKVIVVVSGRVAEIRDPKAEVAPAEEPAAEDMVETDKGKLSWDNEDEDLKEGDAVYVTDAEGSRVAAPDGEYTTEDGKVITVKDGRVASIMDPKAEVSEEGAAVVPSAFERIAQAFQETYDEKMHLLIKAIEEMGFSYPWLVEAGEEFCIAEIYTGEEKVWYRFNIKEWNEEGFPVLENGVKVVPAFVTPEEKEAVEANFRALEAENADLKNQVEALKATPAAEAAHETFEGSAQTGKTGNKGLDRLARVLAAK